MKQILSLIMAFTSAVSASAITIDIVPIEIVTAKITPDPQRNQQHARRQAQRGHSDSQVLEHDASIADLGARHAASWLMPNALLFSATKGFAPLLPLAPKLRRLHLNSIQQHDHPQPHHNQRRGD
jgi:hypothetical protein